jgi:hypothetical protein
MAMATEQYRSMTPHQLVGEIERFINDNDHAHSVEGRWAASYMKSILPPLQEVRNANLSPKTRAQVNAFRALELEEELARQRRSIEQTERELKKFGPREPE